MHDKKLCVLAATSLLSLPFASLSQNVRQYWPQLAVILAEAFATLPAAVKRTGCCEGACGPSMCPGHEPGLPPTGVGRRRRRPRTDRQALLEAYESGYDDDDDDDDDDEDDEDEDEDDDAIDEDTPQSAAASRSSRRSGQRTRRAISVQRTAVARCILTVRTRRLALSIVLTQTVS